MTTQSIALVNPKGANSTTFSNSKLGEALGCGFILLCTGAVIGFIIWLDL